MEAISSRYDVIILGAGAAGLMCAATAGQRGRRVLLLDHVNEVGKKILISGGGRCNFTNRHTPAECYLSENRHFAKSALGRYTPDDFIALVERHRIGWHEKTLGQLFCDVSARQIVDMLLAECARGTATVECDQRVREIRHADARFHILLDDRSVSAPNLVLATGGPSIPKMGATGFAYDVARQFGLDVIPPRPALVPLTLGQQDADFTTLRGVSAPAIVRCGKTSFAEAFLFTHRGLSGPAILQISSYWAPGEAISIDLTPEAATDWLLAAKREKPRAALNTVLAGKLPQRLANTLADRLRDKTGDQAIGNLADRICRDIGQRLRAWPFKPVGTEGYAKAEVTAGGIATSALSSRTLQARTVPGLYVIGEAVDVTGWLGGYNFQWAWASGHAAGTALETGF